MNLNVITDGGLAERKSGKTRMKSRHSTDDKLPVHIVEQHDDVVPFIHRAIASKLLPFSGIPIIHLDSHPDLLIPIHLDADTVFKPKELYESLSIENWLLPLSYAKHIDHVTWVKPPWANQIKASKQLLSIGKCCHTGKLRLSSKENYFLTDGLFRAPKDLTNCVECQLTVVELRPKNWEDLDPAETQSKSKDQINFCPPQTTKIESPSPEQHQAPSTISNSASPVAISSASGDEVDNGLFSDYEQWSKYLQDVVTAKPYILDIDLDFFSTKNPFREEFQSEKEIVQKVFKCPALTGSSDQDLEAFTSARQKQLQVLEDFFSALDEKWSNDDGAIIKVLPEELTHLLLEDLTDLDSKQLNGFNDEEKSNLLSLCQNVLPTMHERQITFSQIFDFGCTLDDTDLPHHVSNEIQIEALTSSFHSVLEHLPKPAIVTISRSSHDDYCPKDQVDKIESMVLKSLADLFGSLDLTKNFDE